MGAKVGNLRVRTPQEYEVLKMHQQNINGENIESPGNELTFYQKKALRDDFRRKWNEDQGLVSIFDKRWIYK